MFCVIHCLLFLRDVTQCVASAIMSALIRAIGSHNSKKAVEEQQWIHDFHSIEHSLHLWSDALRAKGWSQLPLKHQIILRGANSWERDPELDTASVERSNLMEESSDPLWMILNSFHFSKTRGGWEVLLPLAKAAVLSDHLISCYLFCWKARDWQHLVERDMHSARFPNPDAAQSWSVVTPLYISMLRLDSVLSRDCWSYQIGQ